MWFSLVLLAALSAASAQTTPSEKYYDTPTTPNNNHNTSQYLEENPVTINTIIAELSNDTEKYTTVENSIVIARRDIGAISARAGDAGSETEVAELTIETRYGPVTGTVDAATSVTGYYDIPYGKIENIFQEPSEPDAWETAHAKTKHEAMCPQIHNSETMSDLNCLTLSIFLKATTAAREDAGAKASVLFYIHGEDLQSGSGDPNVYGPRHLAPKGVILVLPNYRLGAPGFLCGKNDSIPGNAGLKDLTLALKWTYENIDKFGGDPENIVVSGDGLAGVLVGHLALSPLSSRYVAKAITESGAVLSNVALDRDPMSTVKQLAGVLATKNPKDTTIPDPLTVILETSLSDLILYSKDIQFRPCVEHAHAGSFMNTTPWQMLQDHKYNTSFVMGATKMAGYYDATAITEEKITEINENNSKLLPDDLWFDSKSERDAAAVNVKELYFNSETISLEDTSKLSLYFTDILYLGPSLRTARSMVQAGAKVYFYEFLFLGKLSQEYADSAGAVRGDVASYLFSRGGALPEAGSKDEQVVTEMTELWVSFMNTGTPTLESTAWHVMTADSAREPFLSIGDTVSNQTGIHEDRLALWTRLYSQHFIERNRALGLSGDQRLLLAAVFVLLHVSTNYFYCFRDK
ncbi:hypothetical protein JYU34_018433 [Plutella xylostella]|uniref:Carboxylesterase type B domain-containing protein n=1 Tax=Plutella xylostella TaxID=51655 RepID=A0ABQ7PXK5_PLUXY|nr:hypothetical protein JYU34_018433 [Plutella xylostella]